MERRNSGIMIGNSLDGNEQNKLFCVPKKYLAYSLNPGYET